MNILICCALPPEFNEARNQLGLKELTNKKDLPRIAKSKNITLVYTGIGKINTITSLQSVLLSLEVKPDIIIDTGTCGSLINEIEINTIITSVKAIDFFNIESRGRTFNCLESPKILKLIPELNISEQVVASVENSITKSVDREYILKSGATTVTWETSSLFALSDKLEIPFISIRVVTDHCNENTFNDFKLNCLPACKKLYNYVKNVC